MAEILEQAVHVIVEISSLILELVGIYVMIDAAVRGFIRWIKREEDGPQLEEGISAALEFLMCGEVLKTTIAANMDDYIALGAIIILRAALAFEVHWELKKKEASKHAKKELTAGEKTE